MLVMDLLAVVIPFIVVPPAYRALVAWATSGSQRRARRHLRRQFRLLAE